MEFIGTKEDWNKSGIYIITNTINGKYYIGGTNNFKKRYGEHKVILLKNKHKNKYIQSSFNKYGGNNFTFEILDYVENLKNLDIIEEMYICNLFATDRNIGYNILKFVNSRIGYKPSIETRNKMSIARIGKIPYNKGIPRSDETKHKISEANKGKKRSLEYKNSLIGKYSGEKSGSAILKEIDVIEIKNLLIKNEMTGNEIAKLYNVNKSTISAIKYGRIWKHVKEYKFTNPTRLTELQVIEIKLLLLENKYMIKEVAKIYNVIPATIGDIKNNRSWKHIQLDANIYKLTKKEKVIKKTNIKLNKENVIEIKKLLKNNVMGSYIAKLYNVSTRTISSIKNNRNWKHIKID